MSTPIFGGNRTFLEICFPILSVERYDVVLYLSAGIPVPVVVVSLAVRSDEYGVRNSNGSLV